VNASRFLFLVCFKRKPVYNPFENMVFLRAACIVNIRAANEHYFSVEQSWALAEPSITHNMKLLSSPHNMVFFAVTL